MSWMQRGNPLTPSQLIALLPQLVSNNEFADITQSIQLFTHWVPIRQSDGSWLVFEYVPDVPNPSNPLDPRSLGLTMRIKNKASDLFIGVSQASTSRGATVVQWD